MYYKCICQSRTVTKVTLTVSFVTYIVVGARAWWIFALVVRHTSAADVVIRVTVLQGVTLTQRKHRSETGSWC